jgi:hypothetical protein
MIPAHDRFGLICQCGWQPPVNDGARSHASAAAHGHKARERRRRCRFRSPSTPRRVSPHGVRTHAACAGAVVVPTIAAAPKKNTNARKHIGASQAVSWLAVTVPAGSAPPVETES